MRNLWKQLLKSTLLPTLLIFYILIGVVIYRRNDAKIGKKNFGKALVGYSMEYQIAESRKTYKCDKMKVEKKVFGDDVRLEYDEHLDVFFVRAFFDTRLNPYNYVRMVALIPYNLTFFCQIWRNGKHSDSQKATVTHIWSNDWDKDHSVPYVPALINCLDAPGMVQQPTEISFTKKPCDNSKLKIQVRSITNRFNNSFTVCVKPVQFYEGLDSILKEWAYINKLLGVEKIIIYYKKLPDALKMNPNADFIHFMIHEKLFKRLNSFQSNIWLKRKLEVLAYNDCFYDNLYNTKFIIPLDIDELIVPKVGKNFQEIFKNYEKNNFLDKVSSFSVQNVYFFKNYPENVVKKLKLPMPLNLVNSSIFSRNIRSFYFSPGTDSTKSSSIRQVIVPPNIAQLHHYRNHCDATLIDNCLKYLSSVVYDDSLYRFVNFSQNI